MDNSPAVPTEVILVPIDQLKPNPWNRTVFDPDAMRELVASVKAVGVKEPLIIRKLADGGYQIASGHRRWLAAKEAGIKEVPCYIEGLTDEEVAEDNITINIQREGIPPLELARMVKGYMVDFHKTQQEAADKFGKSQPWVSDLTSFLSIPKEVQQNISALIIAWDPLMAIKKSLPEVQLQVSKELKEGTLKPGDTEKRCRELGGGKGKSGTGKGKAAPHPTPSPTRGEGESEGGGEPDPLCDIWKEIKDNPQTTYYANWEVSCGGNMNPGENGENLRSWTFTVCPMFENRRTEDLARCLNELAQAVAKSAQVDLSKTPEQACSENLAAAMEMIKDQQAEAAKKEAPR